MLNNISVNKNLYKLFLFIIKIIPNILACIKIITLIFNYFNIQLFILTCFSGTSIIFLIILYLISFIFKFCGTHRLSLNYVSLITILTIIDYYIGIPLTTINLYRFYINITGIFITSWIIIWYKNRHNPKIDYIKQLCERYIVCCKQKIPNMNQIVFGIFSFCTCVIKPVCLIG